MVKKKKPIPKKSKPLLTNAQKAGFDVEAYIARVQGLGRLHALMCELSQRTECPVYQLPDSDILTIQILEEVLEALDGD